jgi:hypothetical protein
MRVLVFGADGHFGGAIARELASRGHDVVAASRRINAIRLNAVQADATDGEQVTLVAKEADAIVVAVGARRGTDPETYGRAVPLGAARGVTAGARAAGVRRILVVGGAGSSEVEPGLRLIDSPEFPEAWKPNAQAQVEALEFYRSVDDLDWTYVSPAHEAGPWPRTGTTGAATTSHWSTTRAAAGSGCGDYAVALVDELEKGRAPQRRVTISY